MSGWQPIATSPKDGTVILVYMPGSRDIEMTIAHWSAAEDPAFSGDDDWYDLEGGYPLDVPPTHWMSLPDPPL